MKRFILILFTVCMTMFYLLPNETQAASTSNYQKLVNYIETYGTSSGGYKTITHTSTYEDFAIQARSGYVLFIGDTVISSGSLRIAYHMEFQLKESNNTVYISFKYQEGTGSIQSGSTTVNRATYVRGDKFYSGSSYFASFLNSEFRIICDHWDTFFINNLGFGLKGLGFSRFVGLSGEVCTHTYSNSCDTTCNNCGAIRTITHTYTNACDSSCNICGYVRTVSHTYSDSLDEQCNVCGETRITASSLKYSISGGKVSITGHEGSIKGDLIIPSTIEGYPVTAIGEDAFKSCYGLTSVTIPNSVTTIGGWAFRGCTGLTGIWVASNNSNYSSDSFGVLFNKNKTKIIQAPGVISVYTIPNGVTTIGEYAFDGCTGLKSVTIPASVTTIGDDAFFDCTGLTTVTIPVSVTTIGYFAFRNCTGLTSVTIPDSVTTIRSWAFSGCTSLTGIWVASNNSNYSSDSFGVLFNKSKTTIVQAPGAISEYTIPDSVTTIDHSAFRDCTNLTSVTIPDSVTTIRGDAFFGCTGLKSVTIPDSVTFIDNYAFFECIGLKNVCYTGTSDMWKKINIGDSNDKLKNATKHFEVKWIENCEVQGWFCPECGKVVENLLKNPVSCTYSGACDEYCDVCGYYTEPDTAHTFETDGFCTLCGEPDWLKGDFDDNGVIDNKDVEYLLWHTLFPESYTLPGNGDITGDGSVDNKDVEYLLWHTLFPESYPLTAISNKKKEW